MDKISNSVAQNNISTNHVKKSKIPIDFDNNNN